MATQTMETQTIETEKAGTEHVEQLSGSGSGSGSPEHRDEKHPDYYDTMRIDGDGEDHMHEPPVRSAGRQTSRNVVLIDGVDR